MEGYGNENPGAFQPTRPLRGATTVCFRFLLRWRLFQPTRPLRGATNTRSPATSVRDFNPRAPCGARPLGPKEKALIILISTHAPLAGRDATRAFSRSTLRISTHAPLAGRDQSCATRSAVKSISTHAPLAGRDSRFSERTIQHYISTHAPLAGRDPPEYLDYRRPK